MGRIAEQYLVSQITDLQNVNHTLEKKVEELQRVIKSQDDWIEDLEKSYDFLTGLFEMEGTIISACVSSYEKDKFEKLMDLCGFEDREGEDE